MKKGKIGSQSILNSQILKKYKEELAKEHDFSELDKQLAEKSKENTNLGRS